MASRASVKQPNVPASGWGFGTPTGKTKGTVISTIEWPVPKSETVPRPVKVSNPFCFEDPQVVLQVGEQKYKIHRYFLTRESEFFNDLFSLPQSEDSAEVEGSYDNPIKLPATPTEEIENLLRFFYFGMHDDYVATLADWVAMLSISTRLIFEKVRERAIREITARQARVDAFELLRLAIKFDVEQWLKPTYRRIVTRDGPITHAESVKVPVHMAIMLTRCREQYRKRDNGNSYDNDFPGSPLDLDTLIEAEIRLMGEESAETETAME